jgi:hypothetical protein
MTFADGPFLRSSTPRAGILMGSILSLPVGFAALIISGGVCLRSCSSRKRVTIALGGLVA